MPELPDHLAKIVGDVRSAAYRDNARKARRSHRRQLVLVVAGAAFLSSAVSLAATNDLSGVLRFSLTPAEKAGEVIKKQGYVPNNLDDFENGKQLKVLTAKQDRSFGKTREKAFFFVGTRFIGTDTFDPSGSVSVAWTKNRTVALNYNLYRAGDAVCCPTGGATTVRYQWNGKNLKPLDPIPTTAREARQ